MNLEDIKRENIIRQKIPEEESMKFDLEPKIQKTDQTEYDAPDGGYGWVIVAISFLANMVVDGVINSFGVFLSVLTKEFDAPESKIAWVGSILAGVTLLIGPVASGLTNKVGCRMTCIIGSVLATVSFILSTLCSTVSLIMVTYFLAGIGLGLILLPAVVFVGYYFESKRALATGIALSGSGFGTIVFPPIISYILQRSGWKIANLYIAATALFCSFCGLLMKPLEARPIVPDVETNFPMKTGLFKNNESKSAENVYSKSHDRMFYRQRTAESLKGARNRSQSNVVEYYAFRHRNLIYTRREIFYSGSLMQINIPRERTSTCSSKDNNFKSIIDFNLFKNKDFVLFGLVNIFAMISFYIPMVYIVDYAKTQGIPPGQASLLISMIGIINTVARTFFGYIVNFPSINAILVNNICLLIGSIAVAQLPFCDTFISLPIISIFFGLSSAAYSSLTPIILVELLGIGQLANGFGIIQLFRGVSALMGTPMAGLLLNLTHSYTVPFAVGGGLFFLSTLFGFVLQYTSRKRLLINDTESVT